MSISVSFHTSPLYGIYCALKLLSKVSYRKVYERESKPSKKLTTWLFVARWTSAGSRDLNSWKAEESAFRRLRSDCKRVLREEGGLGAPGPSISANSCYILEGCIVSNEEGQGLHTIAHRLLSIIYDSCCSQFPWSFSHRTSQASMPFKILRIVLRPYYFTSKVSSSPCDSCFTGATDASSEEARKPSELEAVLNAGLEPLEKPSGGGAIMPAPKV